MLIIFTNYSHKTKHFSSAEPPRLSLCTLCWSRPPPYLRPDDKGPRCIRHACPPAHRLSPRCPLQDKTFQISCHTGTKMTLSMEWLKTSRVCVVTVSWTGGVVATWLRECCFTVVGRVTERAKEAQRKAGQHRVAMGVLRKTYSPGLIRAHDRKERSIDGYLHVYTCQKQLTWRFANWFWQSSSLFFANNQTT